MASTSNVASAILYYYTLDAVPEALGCKLELRTRLGWDGGSAVVRTFVVEFGAINVKDQMNAYWCVAGATHQWLIPNHTRLLSVTSINEQGGVIRKHESG